MATKHKSSSKSKSKDEDKKKKKSSSSSKKSSSKSSSKDKKSSKSKSSSSKKSSKKEVAELKPIKKTYTTSALIEKISEKVMEVKNFPEDDDTLAKKVVKTTLESVMKIMQGSIHPKGLGEFNFAGLFKITTTKIPAKKMPEIKKGTMVKNPFNGGKEEPHKGRKAFTKPATVRVKIRPMKKLKDAALTDA